jgi:hypothetical protein
VSTMTKFKNERLTIYRLSLDGVTFTAARQTETERDFTVTVHVGQCPVSFVDPGVKIKGGHGLRVRFQAAAEQLRANPERFLSRFHLERGTISEGLCQDRAACDRFRDGAVALDVAA